MVRNDFVSNSSSSSFIVAFKNEKARKDFAEYCKNSGYGKISDIMYEHIKDKNYQQDPKDVDDNYENYINNFDTFDQYTELSNDEISDGIWAEMKIKDLVRKYNNENVQVVYEEEGW